MIFDLYTKGSILFDFQFLPIENIILVFSHMWSMLVQTRLDRIFSQAASMADTSYTSTAQRGPKFTLVVPSNSAWEKAQMNFHKAYNTLLDGQIPQYVSKMFFSLDQLLTNVLFIPFFIFCFWSLLTIKLQKWENLM